MKKSKILVCSIIAMLLICNVVLLFAINRVKADNDRTTAALYPYIQKYSFLQSNIEENIRFSSNKIECLDVWDKNNQKTKLSSLFSDDSKPLFILRIADRYCNSCVKYFVNLFSNEKISKDIKFVYLTGFQNQSHVMYDAKALGIDGKELYNVQFLDVPIDNVGFPYVMVLGKDLTIQYCYFPTKGYENIDIENINMILDCYEKKYRIIN